MKKEGWKGVRDRRIVHYRALIGGIEVVVSERKDREDKGKQFMCM